MRARFALFLPLILGTVFGSTASVVRSAEQPNILLIVSDDQGYHDLGCVSDSGIKTPHLDRLAVGGTRLTNFYVAWPACTPSRAALLTGRYPQRNGLYDMIRNDRVNDGHRYSEIEYSFSPEMTLGMDLREITIAELLQQAGYRNGMIGKWDGGRAKRFLPTRRGFDSFYGFANTGIDYYTHERYGIPSMFRDLERTEEDRGLYATDLFQREALAFLKEESSQPFFLYVAFNAPHSASNLERDSLQIPEEDLRRYYPDADPKDRRTKYMGMVTDMDEAIGAMIAQLEQSGQLENTLIIFFSDNGGSGVADNGPLRGRKALVLEGGIRVPCIIHWPGHIPAGAVRDDFLTALEIFPTLLKVANVEPPKDLILDGFDMLPTLQGKAPSPRQEMFWERREERAARVGNWKWVNSQQGEGLFDLSKDIGEKKDLSNEKPAKLKELQARFREWKTAMEQAEPRGPFRDY